ncbi:hypothetical protein HF329_32055 [Chitinophaga oryzae]|uniref:Uncharacterized protein n=1 Tax=Chitinophaga oryzae TaxID=2725414 RepID=A0AAE6ZMW7_9BACT|nr:hypothetical protein [Chitinophaga oryzae]QJB35684.1 hypothetical protein HF329_32055 [Chitinophaga oryzae]
MLLFLTSCLSNKFHFDVQHQVLRSDNTKGISAVYLKNDAGQEEFSISWESLEEPPAYVDFKAIQPSYRVEKNGKPIAQRLFKLSPGSTYTIERAGGDAGAFSLRVSTDMKGNVITVR